MDTYSRFFMVVGEHYGNFDKIFEIGLSFFAVNYNAKRLKRFFQRYFPEGFDPEAQEATETIHLHNNAKK